jgi:hypothetical protein
VWCGGGDEQNLCVFAFTGNGLFFLWRARASSHEPLRETQLLALVAGAALPENIVAAIRDRGMSFASDADFREKLEAVGADPRILEALDAAKVIVPEGAKEVPNKEVQKRIVEMATQYKSEKFPDDPRDLLAVIKDALGESGIWICDGPDAAAN